MRPFPSHAWHTQANGSSPGQGALCPPRVLSQSSGRCITGTEKAQGRPRDRLRCCSRLLLNNKLSPPSYSNAIVSFAHDLPFGLGQLVLAPLCFSLGWRADRAGVIQGLPYVVVVGAGCQPRPVIVPGVPARARTHHSVGSGASLQHGSQVISPVTVTQPQKSPCILAVFCSLCQSVRPAQF